MTAAAPAWARKDFGVAATRGFLLTDPRPNTFQMAVATLFAGRKEGAERFFSGRPSEMAMVPNRIMGGPPEAMVELLRDPSRFPDATESHIANWRESVGAWWWHPEKHEVMIASFGKMSRAKVHASRDWVRVRHKYRSREKAKALDEIEVALNAAAISS